MRRFLPCIALLLSMASQPVLAQTGGGGASGGGSASSPDAGQASGPSLLGPDEQQGPLEAPRLRPPSVEPPEVGSEPQEPQEGAQGQPAASESKPPASSAKKKAGQKGSKAAPKGSESGEAAEVQPSAEASPAASATLLKEAAPAPGGSGTSSNPIMGEWTAPASVLTLHGYLRLRGEIWNNFMLSQDWLNYGSSGGQQPFVHFVPIDSKAMVCGSDHTQACGGKTTRFANMRLRLRPTLSLSDDVRVHMMIDVFDNMVLGSTPNTEAWVPTTSTSTSSTVARDPSKVDSFATTQEPPTALRNSFQDSIKVRRAWAEVTNRGIGQLRFGRMGSQWGLGIFQNAGDGIDSDYSTDVDRIMGITKIAGLYIVGSWDWANQGFVLNDPKSIGNYPIDGTSNDNLRQWTMAVARRMSEEDQKAALARGDWVLNGGLYFVIRKQKLSGQALTNPATTDPTSSAAINGFFHRDLRSYTPDIWGQFLWKKLRLETEAVLVAGHVNNILQSAGGEKYKLLQFGWAFESEYRMMADKLGLYLYTGLATGDPNVNGLSSRESMLQQGQGKGNNRITTFAFHPDYRIDLILWRNIMQRVAGAWYLRPSVSYDFLHNSFGQLLGARLDVIYSRAMSQVQAYGSDPNLGLEMDLSAYYRSEDGPGLMDGFYSLAQFGLLFPLAGLGSPRLISGDRLVNPGKAWAFRVLLGVQF